MSEIDISLEPETLDDIAESLARAGCPDSAYRIGQLAKRWRADQSALAQAQSDNSALQHQITAAKKLLEQRV